MNLVNREDFYRYNEPKDRTKARLEEIEALGMEEVGIAQFGIRGVMSGLYIEKVWNLSAEDWTGYIGWVKSLLNKK